MLRKIINKIAYKFYLLGKFEAEKIASFNRTEELKKSLITEDYYFIDHVAYIQNSQANPEKITVGKKSNIKGHLMVFKHGGEIHIGNYSFVGEGTRIWSAKKITIGDRVLISHDVNIHDNISHPLNSADRHIDYMHIIEKGLRSENDLREDEVIIEDDAWIGFNATILKGVRIGKGAIIGACTLISSDVPAYAVVVGNPARIIKYAE